MIAAYQEAERPLFAPGAGDMPELNDSGKELLMLGHQSERAGSRLSGTQGGTLANGVALAFRGIRFQHDVGCGEASARGLDEGLAGEFRHYSP